MAKNKVTLPKSGGGITSYYEDTKSKIRLKPGWVLVFAVFVIILVLVLHMFGDQILGL